MGAFVIDYIFVVNQFLERFYEFTGWFLKKPF